MIAIVLRMLAVEARAAHARMKGRAIVFPVTAVYTWIGGFGLAALIAIGIRDFASSELWLRVGWGGMVLFISLSWPATFICDASGIVQRFWWRPAISIPWNDIVQLESTKGGDLNVYGAGGQRLCFTRFHSAPDRFQAEVVRRAKLRRVIEASDATSMDL